MATDTWSTPARDQDGSTIGRIVVAAPRDRMLPQLVQDQDGSTWVLTAPERSGMSYYVRVPRVVGKFEPRGTATPVRLS